MKQIVEQDNAIEGRENCPDFVITRFIIEEGKDLLTPLSPDLSGGDDLPIVGDPVDNGLEFSKWMESKVGFCFSVKSGSDNHVVKVKEIQLEIFKNTQDETNPEEAIFRRRITKRMKNLLSGADYFIKCSGYRGRRLDTAELKKATVAILTIIPEEGKTQKRLLKLKISSCNKECDWVDIHVDLKNKQVDIEARVEFCKEWSQSGPPISNKQFKALRAFAKLGIERYWSRFKNASDYQAEFSTGKETKLLSDSEKDISGLLNLPLPEGDRGHRFDVEHNVTGQTMSMRVKTEVICGEDSSVEVGIRWNPASERVMSKDAGLSSEGNLVYNYGYWKDRLSIFNNPELELRYAIYDFSLMAAQEFGRFVKSFETMRTSIRQNVDGDNRGSEKKFTQIQHSNLDSSVILSESDESIIKDCEGAIASEEDVKRLISHASLKFQAIG
ncbi:MAG: hypothetical protein GY786_17235 [Proteobacteria bacterium]|nr:hypothetical protein [Pseudomonadota bacterium]